MVQLQEALVQGWFTSGGVPFNIPLRGTPTKFSLMNYTQMATTQNPGRVVQSGWQDNFASAYAWTYTKTNATNALNGAIATSGGYTLINTINQTLGSNVAVTGITNATPPVVSTGSTANLINGDTVRILTSTGAAQIAGMDFTIGSLVANTSFELSYMVAMGSAATGGSYREVLYDKVWSPRSRLITNITQATSAVITLSVTHGYVVGEKLQIYVGSVFGMDEINGLYGTITAINTTTNTVTVDIDSTGFTAFAWPAAADYPFTFAQVVPVGEIPTITSAATVNEAMIAINVGSSVCGASNDVLYWEAQFAFEYFDGVLPSVT